MRVLQIMAGNKNGGAELYSTDVMLSLHETGLNQRIVLRPTAPRFAELTAAGLVMAPEVLRSRPQLLQSFRLRRLIQDYKPDIIHCWMRRAVSLVRPGAAPAIIGWYGDYEEQQKHFSACSHFIGVTQDLVRHACASGAKPGTAFYVPTFPSVEDTPPIDRADLGTPKTKKVLLILSRLHKVKGIDTALYALAQLPDCHLWIAGDGPEAASLKALAKELRVADRAQFLGWRTDRGALLRAADVCLLPSRYEPFGTVILDAWSTATPLIACESDGPKATIHNGENGMLVPADNAPALAEAVRAVLDNPELRNRIAQTGHRVYLSHFTRTAVTRKMLETYETILAQTKRS
ncbi:glycosyltransferase family 4 protein [Acidocella sp.]|uniref:glycosyltransferase family 4 protein n=1 Tax=Acidocella sp. TaxID=50710 RepID=UPI00262A816E|nr:glycosyltransferase family 4 protein [Acidocella sp.]